MQAHKVLTTKRVSKNRVCLCKLAYSIFKLLVYYLFIFFKIYTGTYNFFYLSKYTSVITISRIFFVIFINLVISRAWNFKRYE